MSILVAVGGAHDVVEAGLRSILASDPEFVVMDTYPDLETTVPDVVLYDVNGLENDGGRELRTLVFDYDSAFVVVGRHLRPDLAESAMASGADDVISLEDDAKHILDVIRGAAIGHYDEPAEPAPLGAEIGLTQREVDVLREIVHGKSNSEIAAQHNLSINSIKSYIRSAYRKMDVQSRTQAVSWCVRHGFTW